MASEANTRRWGKFFNWHFIGILGGDIENTEKTIAPLIHARNYGFGFGHGLKSSSEKSYYIIIWSYHHAVGS